VRQERRKEDTKLNKKDKQGRISKEEESDRAVVADACSKRKRVPKVSLTKASSSGGVCAR
jgi:hypothetical protein